MPKIINFIKHHRYLFLLLLISFVSHWYVFFDLRSLNAGDWIHLPFSLLKKMADYSVWNSHQGLGTVISFGSNMPFYWLASFLANTSSFFSWEVFTRLFFLMPIVFLTPLFSFLLFKKILKKSLIAFFGACVYSFNTLFLKLQLDWITYAFVWWILPALFLSIINYLETKKTKYLVYNVFLVFLGFVYELRIMILVLLFLSLFEIFYLIFNNEPFKKRFKNVFFVFLSFLVGILSHAFWLIPLKFGNLFGEVIDKASPYPFYSFYDILDAFTLHMYNWSKNLVLENFIKQPIEFRHFLIPLMAIFGILVFKKRFKEKKDLAYFVFFIISLVGFLFLGKQSFEPFGNFYEWAFYNIPLFNLYRESSKFFILIALSLAFFFGVGLFSLGKVIKHYNKRLAILVVVFILFFSSVFNLQHFIDQKIGGMVEGTKINQDYLQLEKILSLDADYYRILWMPIRARFGFYSDRQAFINGVDLPKIFKDQIDFSLFDKNWAISSKLLFPFQQAYSNQFLDNLNVKYVILPTVEKRISKISAKESHTVNEIYESYGSKEYFVQQLDKISFLKKIDIGTNDLTVYENENYKPYFYASQNIIYSDGGWERLPENIIPKNPDFDPAIFLSGPANQNIRNDDQAIQSQNMLLQNADEILVKGDLKNKISEEELGFGIEFQEVFLPYARQKPGSLVYHLILKEEELDKWELKGDPEKLFEKHLFYSGKRISEFIKYSYVLDKKMISQLVENYKKEMLAAAFILENLKSGENEKLIGHWNQYRKTLLAHQLKTGEMHQSSEIWRKSFHQLEEKISKLKINRDFSKLIYEIDIPKEGEYEVFLNENEENKNLGKKYFERGKQELFLPIKGISENLTDEDLKYSFGFVYRISFDYQAFANSFFLLKEGKDNNVIFATNLFPGNGGSKHFEFFFEPPPEASRITYHFLNSKGEPSDIKYQNFKIQKISQSLLTLRKVTDKKNDFQEQSIEVSFTKINPAKYRIKIEGAKSPYFLVFSENFNQGWRAYIDVQTRDGVKGRFFETWTKKQISEDKHLLVNGYANSWQITLEDAGGKENYEIIIEFWPQRFFFMGLFISILIFSGCLVYLIFDLFKKK